MENLAGFSLSEHKVTMLQHLDLSFRFSLENSVKITMLGCCNRIWLADGGLLMSR